MSFGLITEGVTDQMIIRYLLAGILDDSDIDVRELQPIYDATDADDRFGGWYKVLEYCKSEKLKKALEQNDYLIIQIDTDRCTDIGFDVPRIENGEKHTPSVLYEKVREKLENILKTHQGTDFFDKNKHRIIFAIAVEETECWLAPFYFSDIRDKGMTQNCLQKVNSKIANNHKFDLAKNIEKYHKKPEKIPSNYEKVAKQFRKRKFWLADYTKNTSLCVFVESIKKEFELSF